MWRGGVTLRNSRQNVGMTATGDPLGEVLQDLRDEYQRLDEVFSALSSEQWSMPSGAPGWSILDVVVHLGVSEEGVASTIALQQEGWHHRDSPLDDAMDLTVRANQATPAEVLARWRAATSASITALAGADPNRQYRWAAAPLRPRTLATTRLAEHWAHGLDVTDPLGIAFPDTDRLRHIAWLGHATIPYGCSLIGVTPEPIQAVLTGPSGDMWTYGPADVASTISGSAAAFCRVGAQRLSPGAAGLHTTGPFAENALRVLRNYAA